MSGFRPSGFLSVVSDNKGRKVDRSRLRKQSYLTNKIVLNYGHTRVRLRERHYQTSYGAVAVVITDHGYGLSQPILVSGPFLPQQRAGQMPPRMPRVANTV